MKSGRIGGGLADCLFVCQPFVFRKTGCLFVASQKLQRISHSFGPRAEIMAKKGPERTIVWCVPGLFCCKSRACANRMLPSTLFLKEPPRAGFSRECRGVRYGCLYAYWHKLPLNQRLRGANALSINGETIFFGDSISIIA